ncbi:MAG: hypothetical protein IIA02_10635 [Proteobacteria bacterium]|nr:hypothetical protein [Pseudomonadota bacterium]
MKRFIFGMIFGALLGAGGFSWAAKVVGGNGYLTGWSVTVNGEEACSAPYIWLSTREIECD